MRATESHIPYFTEFLPRFYGQVLIEGLEELDARFAIAVDGDKDPWNVVIERGRLNEVGQMVLPPQCSFHLNEKTLLAIVAGRLSPHEAFFQLDIEIMGDIELGLKLSTVLEPFFQQHPYTPRSAS